ncbi:hypothetical protein [Nocardia cyriacigeorgica]|uniref:hypothetical protein n=1 Tax=Nocardia cyriacigeorgica TaxID=135487 RepID=UPI0024582767|nr:hypothetical protein [Nocardia cyriacigeorgica]
MAFVVGMLIYLAFDADSGPLVTAIIAAGLASPLIAKLMNQSNLASGIAAAATVVSLLLGAGIGNQISKHREQSAVDSEFHRNVTLSIQHLFGYNNFAREASIVVPSSDEEVRDRVLANPFSGIDTENTAANAPHIWQMGGVAVRIEIFNGSRDPVRLSDLRVDVSRADRVTGTTFVGSETGGATEPPQTIYFDLSKDTIARTEEGKEYFADNNVTIDSGENEVLVVKLFSGQGFQNVRLVATLLGGKQTRAIQAPSGSDRIRLVSNCANDLPGGYVRVLGGSGQFEFSPIAPGSAPRLTGCAGN